MSKIAEPYSTITGLVPIVFGIIMGIQNPDLLSAFMIWSGVATIFFHAIGSNVTSNLAHRADEFGIYGIILSLTWFLFDLSNILPEWIIVLLGGILALTFLGLDFLSSRVIIPVAAGFLLIQASITVFNITDFITVLTLISVAGFARFLEEKEKIISDPIHGLVWHIPFYSAIFYTHNPFL